LIQRNNKENGKALRPLLVITTHKIFLFVYTEEGALFKQVLSTQEGHVSWLMFTQLHCPLAIPCT